MCEDLKKKKKNGESKVNFRWIGLECNAKVEVVTFDIKLKFLIIAIYFCPCILNLFHIMKEGKKQKGTSESRSDISNIQRDKNT